MDVAVGDVGEHDTDDAFHHDDNLFLASCGYLYEGAFNAIECSANDFYSGAFLQVDFIGGEVTEFIVVGVADSDELLHLWLGYRDGDVPAFNCLDEVVKVVEPGFDILDMSACGVDKDEVVDGGDELASGCLLLVLLDFVSHGDEAFDVLLLEESFCL